MFFYDFSNYRSYERLTDYGLTLRAFSFPQTWRHQRKNAPKNIRASAKGTSRRRSPQADATGVVSCWLEFPLPSTKSSTTNSQCQSRLFSDPPCQVTEDPELTRVVRQFIKANRAPKLLEKDF